MSVPPVYWKCRECGFNNLDCAVRCRVCLKETNPNPPTFEDLERILLQRSPFSRKIPLEVSDQIRLSLNDIFEEPYRTYHCIHVTGTNGKGSTCWKLNKLFQWCKHRNFQKVGLYHGPHNQTIRERISINDEWISKEDFTKHLNYVLDREHIIHEKFKKYLGTESSTDFKIARPNASKASAEYVFMNFFEVLTMVCFNYFKEQKVDIAIIEVGIGGKHSITNMIKQPVLSIITQIEYDHCNLFGNSLDMICLEKAGIIKKNCDALVGPTVPLKIVEPICQELNAPLHRMTEEDIKDCATFNHVNTKLVQLSREPLSKRLGLENELYDIDENALLEARPPFRLHIVKPSSHENVTCVLDVAHNPNGIDSLFRSLYNTMPEIQDKTQVTLIIGLNKSKDIPGCLGAAFPHTASVVFVHPLFYRNAVSIAAAKTNVENIPSKEETHIGYHECATRQDLTVLVGQVLEGVSKKSASESHQMIVVCGLFCLMTPSQNALS